MGLIGPQLSAGCVFHPTITFQHSSSMPSKAGCIPGLEWQVFPSPDGYVHKLLYRSLV